MPCCPGTGSPTKSPTGGLPRCIPTITSSVLQALYSVPSDRCPPRQQVEIRVGSKLVHIYHRGQLIKTHLRQPRGGRSTDPDDYPAELSAYTTRAPDRIQRSAATLGPAVG